MFQFCVALFRSTSFHSLDLLSEATTVSPSFVMEPTRGPHNLSGLLDLVNPSYSLDWALFLHCCLLPPRRGMQFSLKFSRIPSNDSLNGHCHRSLVTFVLFQWCLCHNLSSGIPVLSNFRIHLPLLLRHPFGDSSIDVFVFIRCLMFCASELLDSSLCLLDVHS